MLIRFPTVAKPQPRPAEVSGAMPGEHAPDSARREAVTPELFVLVKSGGFAGIGERWTGVPLAQVNFDTEGEAHLGLNDTDWAELEAAARYPNSAN